MSIFFGLLFARRFYCRSALSLSPGRTGGLFPRINAPNKKAVAKMTTAFSCSFFQFLTKPAKLFHCQRFGSDGGGEVCGFDRFDDCRFGNPHACTYTV